MSKIFIAIFSVLILVAVVMLGTKILGFNKTGIEKVNDLIHKFGVKLDANGKAFSDTLQFGYDRNSKILSVSIFLGKAFREAQNEETKNKVRKVVAALNDPAQLKNTFDIGGGKIILSEEKRQLFLVKDFFIENLNSKEFAREMETMQELAARWELRWLAWAGSIVHGHTPFPGPPLPITRENEHLHVEFRK